MTSWRPRSTPTRSAGVRRSRARRAGSGPPWPGTRTGLRSTRCAPRSVPSWSGRTGARASGNGQQRNGPSWSRTTGSPLNATRLTRSRTSWRSGFPPTARTPPSCPRQGPTDGPTDPEETALRAFAADPQVPKELAAQALGMGGPRALRGLAAAGSRRRAGRVVHRPGYGHAPVRQFPRAGASTGRRRGPCGWARWCRWTGSGAAPATASGSAR